MKRATTKNVLILAPALVELMQNVTSLIIIPYVHATLLTLAIHLLFALYQVYLILIKSERIFIMKLL